MLNVVGVALNAHCVRRSDALTAWHASCKPVQISLVEVGAQKPVLNTFF